MTTITIELPDHLIQAINNLGEQLPVILEMGMSRYAPLSTQAYREVIAFLAQEELSPDTIVAFRFSDQVEERINELLKKNSNDQLTQAEEVELERLSQLEEQLQLVKATALTKLN